MTLTFKRASALGIAASIPMALALVGGPAMAADDATISVLHAIPKGAGADVVDVFGNSELLIDNFTPGSLETLTVPAGTYDLAVFADGETPEGGEAVIIVEEVEVAAGLNATVTANLSAKGEPELNVFVNDISKIPAGEARVTVRHIAAAPAVDILADGKILFADLANPKEDMTEVKAGDYEVSVNLTGEEESVLGPEAVSLGEGDNTIVYAWGSAKDGDLALATQVITGLGAGPDNVPAGDGSTTGTPLWMLGLIGAAAIGIIGAGARLVAVRG